MHLGKQQRPAAVLTWGTQKKLLAPGSWLQTGHSFSHCGPLGSEPVQRRPLSLSHSISLSLSSSIYPVNKYMLLSKCSLDARHGVCASWAAPTQLPAAGPQQAVGRRADRQSEPLAADLAALCPGCCGHVQNAVGVKCLSDPAPFKHKEDKQ